MSSSRWLPRVPTLALLLAGVAWTYSPRSAAGQAEAKVRVAENFRKDPDGELLARLEPGTPLSVVGRADKWVEVVAEGWVWARSLQVSKREGLDLVVSAPEGENLRSEPSGQILGRLERGTLLGELERRPGWIHVRRQGWLWAASVTEPAAGGAAPTRGAGSPGPTPAKTDRPSAPPASRPGGVASLGSQGAAILSSPDGDTVAHAAAGTELEVISRQGSWARVRLEGWTWLPRRDSTAAAPGDSAQVLTPEDLGRQPEAFRGRMVSWRLQFISLERAEKVRTDFFEGEPFLLTRFGGPDGPFVYVAVPTARIQEMQGLVPLERIRVMGRVRTGASSLTGTPIIDLVSLERVGSTP